MTSQQKFKVKIKFNKNISKKERKKRLRNVFDTLFSKGDSKETKLNLGTGLGFRQDMQTPWKPELVLGLTQGCQKEE